MEKLLENWLKTGRIGDEKTSVSKLQVGKTALSYEQPTNASTALSSKSSAFGKRSILAV
jgi:hypothetical protein